MSTTHEDVATNEAAARTAVLAEATPGVDAPKTPRIGDPPRHRGPRQAFGWVLAVAGLAGIASLAVALIVDDASTFPASWWRRVGLTWNPRLPDHRRRIDSAQSACVREHHIMPIDSPRPHRARPAQFGPTHVPIFTSVAVADGLCRTAGLDISGDLVALGGPRRWSGSLARGVTGRYVRAPGSAWVASAMCDATRVFFHA
jgi:hypothetical protein